MLELGGQVIFFSLSALVVVSFARQGLILVRLNDFLVNYFSWATIFLPFTLLSFGFLISKFKSPLSQPNVLVGGVLFFISTLSLTRAGVLGKAAWEGVATLITKAGAFIVLSGTSFVGIIILFNTSVDQVLATLASFLKSVRGYILGERRLGNLARKQLKVTGSNQKGVDKVPYRVSDKLSGKEELAAKLVSNIPGEDKVWKYPPLDILTEAI